MSGSKWSRRDLLKWGIGAGASTAFLESVGNMIRVPGWDRLLTGSSQPFPEWWVKDSFELTKQLGRFGTASQLATFFQLQEAKAQGQTGSTADDWTLITIKIFDQVHHPLVFALGKLNANGTNTTFTGNNQHPALNKASGSKQYLSANGITDLSDDPRFAKLRFNKWFGNMLKYGTYDGRPKDTVTKNASGYESYVNEFPSEVGIQTGLCLQRFDFSVHNLVLTKIRKSLCDANHFAGYKGLVKSPLGITAFMMGDNYDAAGGVAFNVVFSGLSTAENENFQVSGRSVGKIVQNISQSLSADFGDYRALDQTSDKNLSYLFDKISVNAPQRRAAILQSREKVARLKATLEGVATNETMKMLYPAGTNTERFGNQQALFDTNKNTAVVIDARQEFVSQCAFVANAMQIEGLPYRNFSLFLNVNDLDGADIDNPINGIASSFNALNYVEGMRQLAMGLNIIANAMKGRKVMVAVVSDGGRTRDMGDGNGSSFALVLGPKQWTNSSGGLVAGLDDALHGPLNVINSDKYDVDAPLQNLGSLTTGLDWTSGGDKWGLRNNDGSKATGQVFVGDWQVGVLQFLAEAQGRNIMAPELEKYVRFKRVNES